MKAVLALNFICHSMEAGISYKTSELVKKYVSKNKCLFFYKNCGISWNGFPLYLDN